MQVEWFGQSAFALHGGAASVVIDPFGDVAPLRDRGIGFDYPPIETERPDVVLVTHEHRDHNGVEAVNGAGQVLRSGAGRYESAIGEVVGVSSEHDDAAGTERGHNTIFAFEIGGLRVVHFGDFGQARLRREQAEAIGRPDLLFVPVGGGPTIGGATAAELASDLEARWVVPMHYRTHRIDFLDDEREFVEAMPRVHWLDSPRFDTADLPASDEPLAVVPTAP